MGYVDDTKILLSLPPCNVSRAVDALNSDIEEVSSWCCANSLLINPDKTKLLVVGVPNLTRALSLPPIYLLGEQIYPSSVVITIVVWFCYYSIYRRRWTLSTIP